MEWRDLRHHLFNALSALEVVEIYCIHKENNIIDLCIILKHSDDLKHLKRFTQLRIVDKLIEDKCPEIYKRFVFTYQVYDTESWGNQFVKRVLNR